MQATRLQTRKHRPLLAGIGLALLLQCLFPGGYMPASVSSGWIAALCPDGLPSGFVQHLASSDVFSSSSGVHAQHAAMGHHSPDAQPSGAADSEHDGHSTSTNCQLGAGFDQGVDLAFAIAPLPPVASSVEAGGISQPDVFFRPYLGPRPRAPPVLLHA